jgi:hypothetical protein
MRSLNLNDDMIMKLFFKGKLLKDEEAISTYSIPINLSS